MNAVQEHNQALRRAFIVTAAVLAVTIVLLVLFLSGAGRNTHDLISLPDSQVLPTDDVPGAAPEQTLFAQISCENVQDVLRSLARPSSYHQKLTILRYAESKSRQQTAEIWRSGELLRADVSDEDSVKSILTDGKTLYLWYDNEKPVLELTLRESAQLDELLGLASYETILSLDASVLDTADFVTLDDQAELACIYVGYTQEDTAQYYWVDVDSGLLCRHTMLLADAPVYTMQQIQLERLSDGDESLSGAFVLPDGTEPFS